MRFICFLLLMLSHNSFADSYLDNECDTILAKKPQNMLIFSSQKLIKYGECFGVQQLKKRAIQILPAACSEVIEDTNNLISYINLSKSEAIKIGQCVGVINYIYDNYHNTFIAQDRDSKYNCNKGLVAVKLLVAVSYPLINRRDVLRVLCN